MNLPLCEWFLLPRGFHLFRVQAYSTERVMGDLENTDLGSGVTGKEKGVNTTT